MGGIILILKLSNRRLERLTHFSRSQSEWVAKLEFERRESDTSGCFLARCINSLRKRRGIEKIQNRFSQVVGVCWGEWRPPPHLAHVGNTAAVPTRLAGLAKRAENRCLQRGSANSKGLIANFLGFSGHRIFVILVQPCNCSCRQCANEWVYVPVKLCTKNRE